MTKDIRTSINVDDIHTPTFKLYYCAMVRGEELNHKSLEWFHRSLSDTTLINVESLIVYDN